MSNAPDTPAVLPSARINEQLILAEVSRRMFACAATRKVQIGRYFVLEAIGTGGMGTVYCAYDPRLGRRVALKVLRADAVNGETARRRLRREAVALARLSHPNVVPVHEVGEHGEEVFVAMEYVAGMDLAKWSAAHPLHEAGRQNSALRMLVAAGRGLAAAHRAGLVHGDVKPANILVGTDGRVRIADFGLVRQRDDVTERQPSGGARATTHATLTLTDASAGTPRYAAPEQSLGAAADVHSDQFSFCVAAWEVLFGRPPWSDVPQPEHPPLCPVARTRRWLARCCRDCAHRLGGVIRRCASCSQRCTARPGVAVFVRQPSVSPCSHAQRPWRTPTPGRVAPRGTSRCAASRLLCPGPMHSRPKRTLRDGVGPRPRFAWRRAPQASLSTPRRAAASRSSARDYGARYRWAKLCSG